MEMATKPKTYGPAWLFDFDLKSTNPSATALLDNVWATYFHDYKFNKPAIEALHPLAQLMVLLLNIYEAVKRDLPLGMPLRSNRYPGIDSRYNKQCLTYKRMRRLVERLEAKNLISRKKGSQMTGYTRVTAEPELRRIIDQHDFETDIHGAEVIVLNKKDDESNRYQVEYNDTDDTHAWRKVLNDYNNLLGDTLIDLPSKPDDTIRHHVVDDNGQLKVIEARSIRHTKDRFVKRAFSRGDDTFQNGGRLYGGWWQSIDEERRSFININGEPTVELDFKAIHPHLLYGDQAPNNRDLYEIDCEIEELGLTAKQRARGLPNERPIRGWIKQLTLNAINASTENKAFGAFRDKQRSGTLAKLLTNEQLRMLLKRWADRHPILASTLYQDRGITLMRIDSDIAMHVVEQMTRLKKPILCMHDGFVVQRRNMLWLNHFMKEAAVSVCGKEIPLDLEQWENKTANPSGLRRHMEKVDVYADHLSELMDLKIRQGWKTEDLQRWADAEAEDLSGIMQDEEMQLFEQSLRRSERPSITPRAKDNLLRWIGRQTSLLSYDEDYAHRYRPQLETE
jgi:hypothetical protein